MQVTPLFESLPGVSAFSTHAGFNLDSLKAVTPIQTHTARVITPDEDPRDADGILARGRGIRIGVRTADCLPLLLIDPEAEVIAAVHCGWRGTVARIAVNAVNRMVELGALPSRIHAAMGPCICPDCFEVGEEVAAQFSPMSVVRQGFAKPHVSLAAEVRSQLQSLGVSHIAFPPACSKCDSRFYSVRRQGRDFPLRTLTTIELINQD